MVEEEREFLLGMLNYLSSVMTASNNASDRIAKITLASHLSRRYYSFHQI